MMNKVTSRLIEASRSLVVALALLAVSFALGTSRSHAEDAAALSCPPPALDIVAELAEELDVLCQSSLVVDTAAPTAIEGYAILIEITQSVTIAALGYPVEDAADVPVEDAADITGSLPMARPTE
jgi:hypothetical protein